MLDDYSIVSQARIKTLVVPVGNISRDDFMEKFRILQAHCEVRLINITPVECMFNPQGFPTGRVFLDFSQAENESIFLHDFEPFRKTFLVVGLGVNYNNDLEKLKQRHSGAICHNVIVFGETETCDNVFSTNEEKLETIMCDISRSFIQSLNQYYSSYQHVTLRSPGYIGDVTKPVTTVKKSKRLSGLSFGNSSARVKGRQLKILANFFLLVGRVPDALHHFSEAASLLFKANDYLWLGSTLEGIEACIVLLTYLDVQFQMPPILKTVLSHQTTATPTTTGSEPGSQPGTPRSSFSLDLNLPFTELLKKIGDRILYLYELTFDDAHEFVPQVVYCESIIKTARFMTAVVLLGSYSLEYLVTSRNTGQDTESLFKRSDVYAFLGKIFEVKLKEMPVWEQCQVYAGLASVYGDMGFHRKRSFILRTLFVTLIPSLSSTAHDDIESMLPALLSYDDNWCTIHKSTLSTCIAICEKLQDIEGARKFARKLIKCALTQAEEQNVLERLYGTDYIDEFIIRDITIISKPSPIRKLRSRVVSQVFNPYAMPNDDSVLYCVGDMIELEMVIQNPFKFDITVENIQVEGVSNNKFPITVVKASSLVDVRLTIELNEAGLLTLDKYTVSVAGFNPIECQIVEETSEPLRKIKHLSYEPTYHFKTLTLNIIERQPTLKLLDPPKPVMLLEGETERLFLSLHSALEITTLSKSFKDSTMDPLKQALNNKNLPPLEIQEIEYYLTQRPAIEFEDITKAPFVDNFKIDYLLHGKRGLTHLDFKLEYGNSVYMKTMDIPYTVTVLPSVEITSVDFYSIKQGTVMCLDVLNSWCSVMDVNINGVEQQISPEQTCKMFIPLNDFRATPGKERDSLLSILYGKWSSGDRHGSVDMRSIRLTKSQCTLLHNQSLKIEVNAEVVNEAYKLEMGEFYKLTITVPHSSSACMLRSLTHKSILYNGCLQQTTREAAVSYGICATEKGEYEWCTIAEQGEESKSCSIKIIV